MSLTKDLEKFTKNIKQSELIELDSELAKQGITVGERDASIGMLVMYAFHLKKKFKSTDLKLKSFIKFLQDFDKEDEDESPKKD